MHSHSTAIHRMMHVSNGLSVLIDSDVCFVKMRPVMMVTQNNSNAIEYVFLRSVRNSMMGRWRDDAVCDDDDDAAAADEDDVLGFVPML